MDDDKLIMLGIICSNCNNVIDVLSNKENVLYIDKVCKCGSVGFYTIVLKIKIIVVRPYGKEPLLEWRGHEFYSGDED